MEAQSQLALFFSCDWGTSTFRLVLAQRFGAEVIEEQKSDEGIKNTWDLWSDRNSDDPSLRKGFYLSVIRKHIRTIEQRVGKSMNGIPLVISGMASSSIGMEELPYGELPVKTDGRGIHTKFYEASAEFPHPVLLVSGLRSDDDVMRGEETQLVGVISADAGQGSNVYIFPGTHSKHIYTRADEVYGFKTYMTGEFFDLLSSKSILKESVKPGSDFDEESIESFRKGLQDSSSENLLHSVFKVRTNGLFKLMSPQQNYHYLSGLLIGAELDAVNAAVADEIYLCCGENLLPWYKIAIEVSEIVEKVHIFPAHSAEGAVLRGHKNILTNTQINHG